MDLAFKYRFLDQPEVWPEVSILVLVDLAFKYGSGFRHAGLQWGFNPCFSGSCIQIWASSVSQLQAPKSFNPCFSGSCIQIRGAAASFLRSLRVSILVLVDLAFKCPEGMIYKGFERGFNPCFSGSCIQIPLHDPGKQHDIFVSILVLVDLAFKLQGTGRSQARPGVSILVLVDLAFKSGRGVSVPVGCLSFNPCFSGSCIQIPQLFPVFGLKKAVKSPFSALGFLLHNY